MIGQTISHYKILEKLGEGGMGVVYKAEDTKLKRIVALKFLTPQMLGSEAEKTRFVHEAQAAAALDHPNICTVHEIDEVEGQTFIAMAYVEGQSLKEKIEAGPLKIGEALDIAIQVAHGLQAAHEKGVVHRDVKSANVMVTETGQAKIMDFGLAKLPGRTKVTRADMMVGTIAYMSPEQGRGEEVDHRTDIWSLGVVLYEMITGRLPFRSEYEQAVMYSIMNEEPTPITSLRSNVPMELERILRKAMAKNANERYQHVDEMFVDLGSLKKGLESETVKRPPVKPKRNKRTLIFGFASVLVLLLVGVGLYHLLTGPSEAINSIAVLPLENLSGDKEQEYFVDGMTDALIGELSQISSLRVISRTSAMVYKGARKPLPEIARELHVGAVVEGTVLRAGDKVRITAQLIEATTDRHLWAKNYESELKDILVLQSNVAAAIAREIRAKLTPQEEKRLESKRTTNPEAYQLYLKGRYHWNKRTDEGLKRALEFFKQSLDQDPTFALAYVGMADAYLNMGGEYRVLAPSEARPLAKAAALKALELDPNLGELHASLGLWHYHQFDWTTAEKEFSRAVELVPNYATAHHWYALLLSSQRRFDEALNHIRRAQELDPLSPSVQGAEELILFFARRYEEALEKWNKAIASYPDHIGLYAGRGLVLIETRRFSEGIADMERAVSLSGRNPGPLGRLGYAYGRAGRRAEALKIARELEELSRDRYVSPFDRALVVLGLGEKDQALFWLEKAYEARDASVSIHNASPLLDSVRDDPRFKAVQERMGLEK